MSDNAIRSTTQEFLDVYDIVNDMVLLKDGTAAVILQVGTMNFSLLAEQEQDAVIFTYGSLLNSLNYPIQINIQSQTKDATKYLRLLDEQITKASSDRKATLIKQYRDFVAALIKERNVLQKRFYIIVPASPGEMGLIAPSSVLPGKTAFNITSVEKSILIEKATNILEPRRDHLTSQFNRLGLYVRQLSTQEIIQNFYINYNPEAIEGQEISSSENYTTPLVRASFGGKFMQLNNQQDTSTQNQPATPQPQSPTPEDILSSSPIVDSAPVTGVTPEPKPVQPSVEPVQSVDATQPVGNESIAPAPDPILENSIPEETTPSSIAQAEVAQPIATQSAPVQQPPTAIENPTTMSSETADQQISQAQSVNLDLNLDSNLIDSTFSEPAVALPQTFVEENAPPSVSANANSTENQATAQQSQQPQSIQQAQPVQEASNDFAEDIVPLQNKFETPKLNEDQG